MLSWLIIPFLGVALSMGFLVGLTRHPSWESNAYIPKTVTASFSQLNWQKTGLITLWFDDAWKSQYTTAYPILEKYNLVGSLAVPTKLIGYDAYMNWPQVKYLQHKGWEINSHTRTHNCAANNLTLEQVEEELRGAQKDLDELGLFSESFVTPCGADSPIISEVAKKYYLSLRTSEAGLNDIPVKNPYRIKAYPIYSYTPIDEVKTWIDQARDNHSWLILMFHQVDEEAAQYTVNPVTFEKIIETVSKSKLPVVLPTQVLHLNTLTN